MSEPIRMVVVDDYRVAAIHTAFVNRSQGFTVVGAAHGAADRGGPAAAGPRRAVRGGGTGSSVRPARARERVAAGEVTGRVGDQPVQVSATLAGEGAAAAARQAQGAHGRRGAGPAAPGPASRSLSGRAGRRWCRPPHQSETVESGQAPTNGPALPPPGTPIIEDTDIGKSYGLRPSRAPVRV